MTGRAIAYAVCLIVLAGAAGAQSHDHHGHGAHAAPEVAPGADIGPFPVNIGGPFELTDSQGRSVNSQHDFSGRVVLLFFGYARCPGICPAALDAMENALDLLPKGKAGKVQPVMISIDPGHDTVEILRKEFSREHPRIMGLTGSEAQIKAATDAYKINKVLVHTTEKGEPVYAHGSWIYLLDGGGKLSAVLPPNAGAEDIAAAVGRRL